MSRPSRRTAPGAVVAVLSVLAVAAATWALAGSPGAPEPGPTASPGTSVAVVCPAGATAAASLLPLAPDAAPGRTPAGAAGPEVAVDGAPVDLEPGAVLDPEPDDDAAVTLSADGVDRTVLLAATTSVIRPRLAVRACREPAASAWFTGAAAAVAASSTLRLVNADSGPAVAQVTVLSASGEVETVGLRELTVPGGDEVRVDLAEAAPATGELMVEVRATRGRVATYLEDRRGLLAGGRPAFDGIPAQTAPRRSLTVVGLPRGADEHVLVLGNPGPSEVLARVAVVGATGTFEPEGAAVRVPPRSTVSVDLTEAVDGEAAGVRVTADGALTGTVRSQVGADTAYVGPVRPAGEAAGVVLPARLGADGSAALQLSSAGPGRSVTVLTRDAEGEELDRTSVEVPPAATVRTPLPPAARSVVVLDAAGVVRAAVVLGSADGVAVLPVRPVGPAGAGLVVRPGVR